MTQTSVEKNTAIKRISETIDQVMERENIYQELDKNKLIQSFSTLLDQVSPQMVISLDDERLIKKVRGVMSIELLSTIFDDFTPEQIKTFNAVVEGK
ncbi:MAG: hypothetical protein F6K22_33620 [Okeania sp. SIO2F4]|uniref:hypothetical protein n=1 Tax=Okeania sp. SIO2F4 TaxID=2607790 RepID=UPI00142D0BFB|nr:hypothetical protein [Okeania sp. SIO2F4]MDJ0519868.1 hypothetical protein [Trichodesmium sp. MO_231.B1]NES07301.1 hypothetical protein [Okeania sp. SIO2F4]